MSSNPDAGHDKKTNEQHSFLNQRNSLIEGNNIHLKNTGEYSHRNANNKDEGTCSKEKMTTN